MKTNYFMTHVYSKIINKFILILVRNVKVTQNARKITIMTITEN